MKPRRVKILAVASKGGHWIELLRLRKVFEQADVAFVATDKKCKELLDDEPLFIVRDANRWTKLTLLGCFMDVLRVVVKCRPDVVITTGAAPGLFAVAVGRLVFAKTIWIDSIANVDHLSLSGRISKWVAHRTYTQWPELADDRTMFAGQVLS